MEKIKSRQYSLSKTFSDAILEILLNEFGLQINSSNNNLVDVKKVAECIQKMSDFYIENPSLQTPWNEQWCQIAQLAYFLPLNFLRAEAVVNEAKSIDFLKNYNSFSDFGSGLGALTFHLMDFYKQGCITEVSKEAIALYEMLSRKLKLQIAQPYYKKNSSSASDPSGKILKTFSYSLTEDIEHSEEELKRFDGLLIIEPSTQQDGRKLMGLRKKLLSLGFYIWAPCTHQGACPLYEQSKKDWCHNRIHLNMPDWFFELEKHLPFKNRTITFSYLLASKSARPSFVDDNNRGKVKIARVVGDTLHEKGKSRVMVCYGEEREFLSWLHKDIKHLEIPRGILLDIPNEAEKKSNELRIKSIPENL